MASNVITLDPVQGLVDYVLDIKPYHTKIIEVLVEYVYEELVDTTIGDRLDLEIGMTIPVEPVGQLYCLGGFDMISYDNDGTYPVITPNPAVAFEDYPAISAVTNSMIFPGDQTQELKTGSQVYIYSAIEDFTNIAPIVSLTDGPGGSFDVPGNFTLIYTAGFTFSVFGSFGNDGAYTVTGAGSTFGAGNTNIPVVEVIPDPIAGGKAGLVETSGPHNGFYTISNVEAKGGSINQWPGAPDPFTLIIGDSPHTVVTFVEPIAPIPGLLANQKYVAGVVNSELMILDALSYSNVASGDADEGIIIEPITGVDTGANTFTVAKDFSDSNMFIGDTLQVTMASGNNGIYEISGITYGASTIFEVVEVITDPTVEGNIVFNIGANVFIVDGDSRSRFQQGKVIDVVAGTAAGTYNVLTSDFINGTTRIRVLETIEVGGAGSPVGSPAVFGFIQDHLLGYAEFAPFCSEIGNTRVHVVFSEELIIEVDQVGSPVGSP